MCLVNFSVTRTPEDHLLSKSLVISAYIHIEALDRIGVLANLGRLVLPSYG